MARPPRCSTKKVKPERDNLKGYSVAEKRRDNWWQFGTYTPALHRAIDGCERVLSVCQTTKYLCFAFLPAGMVYSNKLIIFPFQSDNALCLLQSRIHEAWALFFGSTLKDDPVYTPPSCFETFPFPPGFETDPALEAAGRAYHEHRAALMVARNEGMTKTYNRFHDRGETAADIVRLRELHAGMDRAVLEAYGWGDLALSAEPIFLDESNEDDHTYQGRLFWPSDFRDKLLSRLLALNAERHAEEVRLGIAPGMKGKDSGTDNDDTDNDGDDGDST